MVSAYNLRMFGVMLSRPVALLESRDLKKLIERSRVCHNHKSQPTLVTKWKRKMTKTYTRKTNKQMYEKHKDQLPLPQVR